MKLLFFMETVRARGAERVAAILTEQLAAMSHEVYFVCTGFIRGDEFPLSENVHLEFIPEATGSRLHLMFVRIRYIRKKIDEIKPDCILTLAVSRSQFMIMSANRKTRIPMIFSERNDPLHDPKSKAERLLRRITFHACDRIVFQTSGARDFFPEAIAKKGTIIPNPIKNDLPPVWEGARKPYITTFCKLVPQKNLPLLLRAFAKIADDFPDLRLVVYGDGDERTALEHEAERLTISSRTDFRPHALDVHDRIRDSLMYISSSDYEGQSNSMLEAMAMGLPCVCTDCPSGGARDVIQNGVNGLLVPVGDEIKLAEAMRFILTHPDEAAQMGRNAAKIKEDRRPELIAKAWERLIIDVISDKCRQ